MYGWIILGMFAASLAALVLLLKHYNRQQAQRKARQLELMQQRYQNDEVKKRRRETMRQRLDETIHDPDDPWASANPADTGHWKKVQLLGQMSRIDLEI